jgi:uncharacterized protein with PIN domain
MKFLVDQPLAGVAKRLRFLGFDAACRRLDPRNPGALPPPAANTYILTRQETFKHLARTDLLFLTASTLKEQLTEVIQCLKISRRHLATLSRCSRCNARLRPVGREQAQALVPEHVFVQHQEFYECPGCRRIFWPGSHLKGITRDLLSKFQD